MALQPHRLEFKPHTLEFIFAMVLAMAVTVLAITTWAAPSNPESDWAAPSPPIYRSQHLNLYLKGRQAARGMNVGWVELRPRATRAYVRSSRWPWASVP